MIRGESMRQAWGGLAILAMVVVAAVNVAAALRRTPPAPRVVARAHNAVMQHEERFAAVRGALEARAVRGTIGYLGDLPPEQMRADWRAMDQYFMTQFALVPWVLDADVARFEWVVTNLRRANAGERVPPDLRVVHDFGGGVLLLRRAKP